MLSSREEIEHSDLQGILTVSSIDTKHRIIVAARRWHWNLTVFAYVLDAILVYSISAVAKLLFVAIYILYSWDAFSAVVAFVITVFASDIRASAM